MGFRTFLTLATLGLAAAESSVVSLFLIGNENPQPLVGSIVAVDDDTTTYSINCAKTVDTDHCAFRAGLLYTAGPSSIEYALITPYDRRFTLICSMGGTTSAVCTDMMPTTGTAVAAYTTTLGKEYLSSEGVTINAGATRAATGSSATKTDDSSKATNSGDSTSQTASGSASTSTGGIPRITAVPGIALGGAAAALMVAAL
ncbi:hypothetical protein N7481_013202 [Penicillium waksmanii]|uniref:uncharacterized protein n=1 Tax=Penicillium waksmanii TaxID=69791 RepID=UPI0025488662|nr:uncharacterized protein N7481_013202 [Penicillium waksmanii]KAJ5966488.1 hypothetical protein N7481_013202 [Penicillium waksmanii]